MPVLVEDLGLIYHAPAKKRVRMAVFRCACDAQYTTRCWKTLEPYRKACKSCVARKNATIHGNYEKILYKKYQDMVRRCNEKKNSHYYLYGARGIQLCNEWLESYESFERWALDNGYEEGLTIERLDNDNGYSPENCTFIPLGEQPINRRRFANNTSGYKGVSYQKSNKKYKAYIGHDKRFVYLGMFKEALDAAKAYNDYIDEHNLPHAKNPI